MKPLTPRLTVSPSSANIASGTETVFTCVTDSIAIPTTYEWYKNGVLIPGSSTDSRETYTIDKIATSDTANYTCTATIGGIDSSGSEAVEVNVVGKLNTNINSVKCCSSLIDGGYVCMHLIGNGFFFDIKLVYNNGLKT